MIRVLFADDEPKIRSVWERLIDQQSDMCLVGTLESAEKLTETATELSPDIVVIDLTMPGPDPLDAVRSLTESSPQIKSVFYSAHSDDESVQAAFDVGAWGYIPKLASIAEICQALRQVADGEVTFPPDFLTQ